MTRTLSRARARRLEGLCERPADTDRIRIGCGGAGIERLEARLAGRAFAPHRHDTYAIGVTLSGVQSFRYRGAQRACLPGQCHVLHPDERHDGGAGTADGFAYRIVYVDPALIQQALGGRPLPFVADPVLAPAAFRGALPADLWRLDAPIDDVVAVELVGALADLLARAARSADAPPRALHFSGLLRVRERIGADPAAQPPIATLEAVSGLDRWALARQFRAAFGTSPSRFRTMRQLDRARGAIRAGCTLADAAADAGFADQSHLSRQFKRAYGLTPGRWAAALRAR
jgi:AraC-like DNA-binding protein